MLLLKVKVKYAYFHLTTEPYYIKLHHNLKSKFQVLMAIYLSESTKIVLDVTGQGYQNPITCEGP